MWRRYARLSEKTSDAQFARMVVTWAIDQKGILAAARLRANRRCAKDLPLCHCARR